jgi:hypothetical protein
MNIKYEWYSIKRVWMERYIIIEFWYMFSSLTDCKTYLDCLVSDNTNGTYKSYKCCHHDEEDDEWDNEEKKEERIIVAQELIWFVDYTNNDIREWDILKHMYQKDIVWKVVYNKFIWWFIISTDNQAIIMDEINSRVFKIVWSIYDINHNKNDSIWTV